MKQDKNEPRRSLRAAALAWRMVTVLALVMAGCSASNADDHETSTAIATPAQAQPPRQRSAPDRGTEGQAPAQTSGGQTSSEEASKEASKVPSKMFPTVLETIRAIEKLPKWTKSAVESALGLKLSHASYAPAGTPHYETSTASGPFKYVVLREPTPNQASVWSLRFDIADGVALPFSDFVKAGLISRETPPDINPDIGPEGVATYTVQRQPGCEISFEFHALKGTLYAFALGCQRR